MSRVNEHEVAEAVAKYLADHNGEAAIAELVANLPGYLNLSDADRQESETRPGEQLWEQQVRNIISHRNSPGNAIHDGLLEYDGAGHLRLA